MQDEERNKIKEIRRLFSIKDFAAAKKMKDESESIDIGWLDKAIDNAYSKRVIIDEYFNIDRVKGRLEEAGILTKPEDYFSGEILSGGLINVGCIVHNIAGQRIFEKTFIQRSSFSRESIILKHAGHVPLGSPQHLGCFWSSEMGSIYYEYILKEKFSNDECKTRAISSLAENLWFNDFHPEEDLKKYARECRYDIFLKSEEEIDDLLSLSALARIPEQFVLNMIVKTDASPRKIFHGDFGSHNIIWDGEKPYLIDWDKWSISKIGSGAKFKFSSAKKYGVLESFSQGAYRDHDENVALINFCLYNAFHWSSKGKKEDSIRYLEYLYSIFARSQKITDPRMQKAQRQMDIVDSAQAATTAKDWKRASRLWAQAIEGGQATEKIFARLIEALRHEKRPDEAARVCRQGLEHYPQFKKLHLKLGEVLYAAGRFEEAMASFEAYGRMVDDQAGGGVAYVQRLTTLHKKLKLPKAKVKASWERAAGELSQQANDCRVALKSGDYPRARTMLAALLAEYEFDSDETRDIWLSAFDVAFGPEPAPGGVDDDDRAIIGRKLMVSGMGWSGSGAILDYFCENAEVNAILREYRHIEGDAGVKYLRADIKSKTDFKAAFADFFFLILLGLGNSLTGDKDASLSKFLSLGEHGRLYARRALIICAKVRQGLEAEKSSAELLRPISNETLDAICMGHLGAPKKTVLFDNVVHAYSLDAVPAIDHLSMFCAFRDPRSNYVARIRESKRFAKTIKAYVQNYRKIRQKIDALLEQVEADLLADDTTTTRVHTVQFEEFVLSRACRQDLARNAGLDMSQHDEYTLFQPWVSHRNVFLHDTYEKQDEIDYIARELPEYCVDLKALDAAADDDSKGPAGA